MKHACWFNACLVVAVMGLVVGVACADDWPQFQGPDRNGISKETGLLKQWPAGGPQLLWTATGCGTGYSSAAIADGTIYVSGNLGDQCQVMALGLDGKTVKWKRAIGAGGGNAGGHPGARSTPTVDGDSVYCLSPAGDLACMDAKTGNVKWSNNIKRTFRGSPGGWAYAESVMIDGNNVICTPGGPDATLVALNKKTGATVWTSGGLSDPAAYASPILFKVGNARIISTLTARGVVGVSAANGTFLWRYDRPSNGTANCPSPVFYKNSVFCASGYNVGGGLIEVSVTSTGSSIKELWQTADLVNHHGGYVIIDDHIYGFGEKREKTGWMCLDIKDGHATWVGRGIGKGSVITAEGMLYCFSEGWQMGLVRVNPEMFDLVSQFRVPKNGSGERSWAHPSIANGRLYLRDDDGLMCYDIKAK